MKGKSQNVDTKIIIVTWKNLKGKGQECWYWVGKYQLRGSQLIKADRNWRIRGKKTKNGQNQPEQKDKQQTF